MKYPRHCPPHNLRRPHINHRTGPTGLTARRLTTSRIPTGFSLVELMVAMVLGLLVATAAMGIFAAHRATYGKTSAVDKLQENTRAAFELMARDIRAADTTVCRGVMTLPTSRSYESSSNIPADWTSLGGFNSSNDYDLINFTIPESEEIRVTSHEIKNLGDREVTFKGKAQFKAGDRVLICDNDVGHIAKVKHISQDDSGGSFTYEHKTLPGQNGTGQFKDNPFCKDTPGTPVNNLWNFTDCTINQAYQPVGLNGPAYAVKVTEVYWMVQNDASGDAFLYRAYVLDDGVSIHSEKIIPGVNKLKISYLLAGGDEYFSEYNAWNVNKWPSVRAVRIVMGLESPHEIGKPDNVKRQVEHVVSLRGRTP